MNDDKLPLRSSPCHAFSGSLTVPGDKSLSHRALMLSSQILGTTLIEGMLEGEDVLRTAAAMRQLGVRVEKRDTGSWCVHGVGVGGLQEPSDVLDMGNSGTSTRLLMGLVSPYPFKTFFTGDASLRSRPMKRVTLPLSKIGAQVETREGGKLPAMVTGTSSPLPIHYILPVASAQVKSAILLAALNIAGRTTVEEPEPTRDHTERMLRHFGWQVEVTPREGGGNVISLTGHQQVPRADQHLTIPGDPSSAAFPVVAALIVEGADVTITNICVNPLRTGLYSVLREMGADIAFTNPRISAGEEVADIRVRHSKLHGIEIPAHVAPSMIDEYPILAVAASVANGTTVMHGLAELRVKESDRLNAIFEGLRACGIDATAGEDTLTVRGNGNRPPGGATVRTHFDHRIAMSFLVLGMASHKPVEVDDATAISTSFPNFVELLNGAGAHITSLPPHSLSESPPHRGLVVAVDGPAASGKGTLARRISEHLDIPYLDTGSLYRAVGLRLIYSGKNPYDKRAAMDAARSLSEQDLSNPRLRQERIGKAASIISAIPEVRAILLDFQRRFAQNPRGAVLDGRDIGTIVCPEADVKIFITANLETRARRRHRELQGEGIEVVYESVLADLHERDERDAKRAVAPLIPSADAFIIDTSQLDAEAVFMQAIRIINQKHPTQALATGG